MPLYSVPRDVLPRYPWRCHKINSSSHLATSFVYDGGIARAKRLASLWLSDAQSSSWFAGFCFSCMENCAGAIDWEDVLTGLNDSEKVAPTPASRVTDDEYPRNEFLERLLTLQQDGSAAISSPSTWSSEPLLRIRTNLDDVVDNLVQRISAGIESRGLACWHFFVGSPGNGKSAGTGTLARRLVDAGFAVRDADGTELVDIAPDTIPYTLQVFEPGKNYACAYIAQDASVVPDPYAERADPAVALVDLLKEVAAKGRSLIVCTNRGVLERAYAAHYLDPSCNGSDWFKAVQVAVLGEDGFRRKFDGAERKLFESVDFNFTRLDQQSLLVGRDDFERLVEKAIEPQHWGVCRECAAHDRCPFFQNMRWLADVRSRAPFIKVVRHAEILSGQVIVFREALALLSLILSGCPHDYENGSPCSWVHRQIARGQFFSLLSRRVYMALFSAYAPYGLEPFADDREVQQRALKELARSAAAETSRLCEQAMREVVNMVPAISADVGVGRLVGPNGIFRSMDCASDIQANAFYEQWDDSGQPPFTHPPGLFSDLERCCAEIWLALRDAAEARGDVTSAAYRWLSRWITAHTHRAGSLLSGTFAFSSEVESIVKILSLEDPFNEEGLLLIEQIEGDLWRMLDPNGEGIQISAFSRLKGEWVKVKLKPRVVPPDQREHQSIVLNLELGENTCVPLNAFAFAWLKRRRDRGMLPASFPLQYLESAGDALIKAASESHYYIANDDIGMIVTLPPPNQGKLSLRRSRGRVIVDGI